MIPLQTFARQQFTAALADLLAQGKSLDDLEWLLVTPRFERLAGSQWPIYGPAYHRQPGLLRLMQNFEKGADFHLGTGLVDRGSYQVLSGSAQTLAARCHQLDAGGKYQKQLEEVFDAQAQALLKADKQAAMKLAIEVATSRGRSALRIKSPWITGSTPVMITQPRRCAVLPSS